MGTTAENLPDDVDALKALVLEHTTALEEKDHALRERDAHIAYLREQLNLPIAKRFAPSSEKAPADQLGLFNEAEAEADSTDEAPADEAVTVPAHARKRPGRRPLPDYLPRVDIVHEVPDTEKQCPCGCGEMASIGEDVSEQLDIIPAKVQVLRHVRPRYACPRCQAGGVAQAPMPPQPIPKSLASPGLLAYVATAKYVDALPLYRQHALLGRTGIELSRTTLANWMVACGALIQPLINLLRDTLLAYDVLQMDDKCVRNVFGRPKGGPEGTLSRDGERKPRSRSSRSPAGAPSPNPISGSSGAGLPAGLSSSTTMIPHAAAPCPSVCWPDTRAICRPMAMRFMAPWPGSPTSPSSAASPMHGGNSTRPFAPRAGAPRPAPARPTRDSPSSRSSTVSSGNGRMPRPRTAMPPVRPRPDPSSMNSGPGWTNPYFKCPRSLPPARPSATSPTNGPVSSATSTTAASPSTTTAARTPFVPSSSGKNWLFSNTPKGATASANLYALIETAKANGLEPYAYLRHVFTELPRATTVEALEALLPWNVTL